MSRPESIQQEHRLVAAVLAVASFALVACTGGERQAAETSAGNAPVRLASTTTPTLPPVPVTATPAAAPAPVVSYENAETAFRERRYEDARALFEAYVENRPDNPWGHYMLGLSAWRTGDFAGADAAFTRALELDPKHVKSLVNSSRVLIELGREHEAVERLTLVTSIDSTSEALRLLGRATYRLGQVPAAVEFYLSAIRLDDQDAWAFNNLGMLYLDEGIPVEALGPLARAVQLRPGAPVFQNNLGMALEQAGHFVAAKLTYEAAVRADSTYGKAVRNLERINAVTADAREPEVDVKEIAERFRIRLKVEG